MADEWFYTQNGQQAGPVDFTAIQQMAAAGQIRPGDLIWKPGMPNWAAASTIPGVFPTAAPPPPPPPQGYPPPPPPPPGYAPQGAYPPSMQGYPMPLPGAPNHIGMARTAMILSLVGLLCFGPVTGLLAVIFGGIALSGMSKTGDNRGRGMAVTGLVLGILDMVFGALWFSVYMHRHHY